MRDRALIGLMVFTFARVGAAVGMKVEDYFIRDAADGFGCTKRAASATRCRQTTISKLTSRGLGLGSIQKDLFSVLYSARRISSCADLLTQADAYRMIRRRAKAAGIHTKIGNHTFASNGHYRLSQEWRSSRGCATDCGARVVPDNWTIR